MSSPKRAFRVLSWFAWSLITWLALAGILADFLKKPEHLVLNWSLLLTMPSLAVFCAWKALRAGAATGRWARVVFWMVTLPGIALCVLGFRLEFRTSLHAYDRNLLVVSCILPVLVLIFAGIRQMRARDVKIAGFGMVFDILGGGVCFAALVVAVYFTWLKMYVEPLRRKAEQRWAEIGLPMSEFEKTIRPSVENDSLRELTRDLKPFGVVTMYKTGSGGGRITAENKLEILNEAYGLFISVDTKEPFKMPSKASAALDASANDFNRLYAGILHRDPPVWEMDISAGFSMLLPNYQTSRKFAQWIGMDAHYRMQKGDEKGAADAVAAEMRMIHDLGEQPNLVSTMINTAIKALFATVTARLPEDPDAMRRLAADVEKERRQFQRTIQAAGWKMMNILEKTHPRMEDLEGVGGFLSKDQLFPDWLERRLVPVYCQSFFKLQCSQAWLYEADVVEICGRVRDTVPSDLGKQEIIVAEECHPSIFAPSLSLARAWLRLNFGLLVREQAEIIRSASAKVKSGKSGTLGECASVVIPGSKWIMTGDAAANTITVKLTPIPRWTMENTIADDNFWLIPLDGSKPWKLQPAPGTTETAK